MKDSFNGLLSVTPDGGSLIGESPEVRGFGYVKQFEPKRWAWMCRLCAEWMANGKTQMDIHSFDIARFYPAQKGKAFVKSRSLKTLKPYILHPSIQRTLYQQS